MGVADGSRGWWEREREQRGACEAARRGVGMRWGVGEKLGEAPAPAREIRKSNREAAGMSIGPRQRGAWKGTGVRAHRC